MAKKDDIIREALELSAREMERSLEEMRESIGVLDRAGGGTPGSGWRS